MMRSRFFFFIAFAVLFFSALVSGCANIGNPSGGPRDEDPPVFMSANPAPGSLNVTRTNMSLSFNELINVKDPFTNVVVSPVSKAMPRIQSNGRNISIRFDSLEKNQTYTIDFGNSIEDNNEANKLQGFAYTFSTGPTIDTLRISGMVLGARNLEPQQNILVGVTQNIQDSAFTRLPLLRVAKTDDRGRFSIRGLAPGEYRVYALKDLDNDYKYANPEEDMAFYDFVVSPYTENLVVADTIYDKLGNIDSITSRPRTRYLPNDILLRSFNSEKRKRYLEKYERQDSTRLYFKFNTPAPQLPVLDAIGYPGLMRDAVVEYNEKKDSVMVWLPPTLASVDSLRVLASYLVTDSTGNLSPKTDSLRFYRLRRLEPKNKKSGKNKISKEDSIKAVTLEVIALTSTSHDVYRPVQISFETPLERLDTAAFRLEMKVDTLWRPVPNAPMLALADTMQARIFEINYPWKFGQQYRVVADSLAAVGIYGKVSPKFSHEFTVKKKDEYCSLKLNITGLDPGIPAFVELLSSGDNPLRTLPVKNGTVLFEHLSPGKYYARVIEDYNGNGLYDTGDYDLLLQPELAYYYPKAINIKKNWDKEESWDVFATAIDLMKPDALKKNKPTQDPRDRRNQQQTTEEEEEDDWFDPTANPFDPNQKRRPRPSGLSY